MLLSVALALAVAPTPLDAQQATPKEILSEIRAKRDKAPAKLFEQLGKLGTEDAFEALCDAIEMQKNAGRKLVATRALRFFNGVPDLEMEAVEYLRSRTDTKHTGTAFSSTVILGEFWPAASPDLVEIALETESFDLRSAALMGLVKNGMAVDEKALKRMASSKDVMVRYEGALALLQLESESSDPEKATAMKQREVLKASRSKQVADRLAAVEYLRMNQVAQMYALLEARLSDKDPRVNRKCLSVLESLATADAVGVLVRRMNTAEAGERWRTAEALRRLSGMSFRADHAPWKRWWKAEKDRFKAQTSNSGAAQNGSNANGGEKASNAEAHDTGAAFYGLPIRAQHLVFAVDSSNSMNGKTGSSGRSRIDIAKEQLRSAISDLPDGSTFDIVDFGKNAISWNGELISAKSKVKRRALEHVDKMKLSLGTQVYEALRTAFKDPTADAIVLLTDGDPQITMVMDRNLIRQLVVQWNRTRHLQVDCITIGTERGWLRKIAVATGGRYKRVE